VTILIDSSLSPIWVEFLKSAGIDSVHWWNIGAGDAPDSELLEWAAARDATIFTSDGDFPQMLALRRLNRPSVILLKTNERNPQRPGQQVIAACRTIAGRTEGGMIVVISERGARVRNLPISSAS
jgi:predicted nuclease of predicted toxin-antitoxin system